MAEEKKEKKQAGIFDKIGGLRGILYRRTNEAFEDKRPADDLPMFKLGAIGKSNEISEVRDATKLNITYPLIEPYSYANVKWNSESKEVEYLVVEPQIDEKEKKLFKIIYDTLIEMVEVGFSAVRNTKDLLPYLQKQVSEVINELDIKITPDQYQKIMYYIYKNFVGLNEIEPLMQDPNIEDISCDGVDTPLYVIHRRFGSIKTSVSFKTMEELREFVVKLAERSGRYVSYAEPILDGTLPDGSRVSATMAGDVATRGPTFTIRKFSEKPFSPVEQIEMKTVDAEILAYFWYLVEHGASMLIVGGVATGKTSLLNTISMFIPPEAKIVSIEDTREIRIPHEHWVAGLARSGFGVPTQGGQKYGEVTLFDLLKESFRQNPDYVIVGEVRGAETYVMFQGMSSGHPSLSTFHAGSVESVIKRLTTPPIELSPSLIESLDIVAVMIHARERGKSARRVKEVAEIISVDPKTQEVKTNVIYRWDPVGDVYVKVNDSIKLEKLAIARGGTLEDAVQEVADRKKVIEWLGRTGNKDFIEVSKYINMYVKEKGKLLATIGQAPQTPAQRVPMPIQVQQPMQPAPQLPAAPPVSPAFAIRSKLSDKERAERIKVRKQQILGLLGMMSKGS